MRILLVALMLVPLAAAQGHDHAMGSGYAVATDIGPSGLAHAGSPVHFEVIAFGDDHVPDFHQDLPFRVLLDNVTLYESSTLTGHDYDGVHGFDVVFPRAGAWRVEVVADGEVMAYREGIVSSMPLREVDVSARSVGEGAVEFDITYADSGHRANHTDLLIEYLDGARTLLRTHLHIHDQPVTIQTGFLSTDDVNIRATAYSAFPTSSGSITPQTIGHTVALGVINPPPQAPALPAAAQNAVTTGSAAAGFSLIGTYDPYTVVGPDTLQHLSALVIDDATGMPVQHVDFTATLRGPNGLIFTTSNLHEYDGIYDVAVRQPTPGQYVLDVTADRGDWSGAMQMSYMVAPPAMANVVGPQLVSLMADDFVAAAPGMMTWRAADVAGMPFAHGEIEMQIRDADGLVLLRDKLHTHGDGTFPFTVAFPDGGAYTFELDPFPLNPQPTGPYYRDTLGTPLAFAVEVTGSAPADTLDPDATTPPAEETTPMPVALLLVGLAIAFAARKR